MGVADRVCMRMGLPVLKDQAGQMTVEFAVAFPVMLIVAVVAVNVLLFFGECASFDRIARDSVRVHAASPAYGQTTEQTVALVRQAVEESLAADNETATVSVAGQSPGLTTFTATLRFSPTLFGLGLKSSVFGVELPCLEHSVSMTVDAYKPGVII
ncbi:MAG: hypothetical protein RR547_01545 [Raoultibacter sp.]